MTERRRRARPPGATSVLVDRSFRTAIDRARLEHGFGHRSRLISCREASFSKPESCNEQDCDTRMVRIWVMDNQEDSFRKAAVQPQVYLGELAAGGTRINLHGSFASAHRQVRFTFLSLDRFQFDRSHRSAFLAALGAVRSIVSTLAIGSLQAL